MPSTVATIIVRTIFAIGALYGCIVFMRDNYASDWAAELRDKYNIEVTPNVKVTPYTVISGSEYLSMTPEELEARLKADGWGDGPVATAVTKKRLEQGEDVENARLWQEQWVYWEYVDQFKKYTTDINRDGITLEEEKDLCYMMPKWGDRMTEAVEYVEEFRDKVEYRKLNQTYGLNNLEREADRALELIADVEAECS